MNQNEIINEFFHQIYVKLYWGYNVYTGIPPMKDEMKKIYEFFLEEFKYKNYKQL